MLWIAVKYWNYGTELISVGDTGTAKQWIEHALAIGEFCSNYPQIENVSDSNTDEAELSKALVRINSFALIGIAGV